MIRTQPIAFCLLGALAATALAFGTQAPQEGPTGAANAEITVLTEKVTALEAKIDALTAAQAKAGKALVDACAKSKTEGFTAGINPRSREILLDALQAQGEAMQSAGAKKTDESPSTRRSNRGKRRSSNR